MTGPSPATGPEFKNADGSQVVEPELSADEVIARIAARRRDVVHNPTVCSHCLTSSDRAGAMLIETKGEEGKILLCSFRCMAIWSMTRGWQR